MTCVVGMVQEGSVYLAADRAGTTGSTTLHTTQPKVFTNGAYLIGYTSSFRMGQLLQHAWTPPTPPADPADLLRFMVFDLVNSLKKALKSGGYGTQSGTGDSGGQFLIGVQGRLFDLQSDYQVFENTEPYAAVGSGANIARGALHASTTLAAGRKLEVDVLTHLLLALEAAEHFNSSVCGPFDLEISADLAAPRPKATGRGRKRSP